MIIIFYFNVKNRYWYKSLSDNSEPSLKSVTVVRVKVGARKPKNVYSKTLIMVLQ